MKRAVISDIHANLMALKAVLDDCLAQQADDIVCLGDICGYGPDPVECVDLINSVCEWSLCGNHDAALFMLDPIGFNRYAKAAVAWQRQLLKPRWYDFSAKAKRWEWLSGLAAARKEDGVLYVHASPRDPLMEYVEESDFADIGFGRPQKAIEMFDAFERLCFCGHSHRPGVVTEAFEWLNPEDLPDMLFKLPPDTKTLVNVGSVGQPRDGNPHSCYVILDSVANTAKFRRVPYDLRTEQARFRRAPQLNERLWRRLEFGL